MDNNGVNLSTDAELSIVFEETGSECLVSLSGRITIDSSPALRDRMIELLQSASCQSLTADFYNVDYVDTSGLAILVEILKAARTQGKKFHLSRLRERPRYLLESTRLLYLFDGVTGQPPPESARMEASE